ncbi:MAG: MG2 domain-containing protein, partial [Mariprofundales bacterium]
MINKNKNRNCRFSILLFILLLLAPIQSVLATATAEVSSSFSLLNISERSYDGQPAISLLFSEVLNESIDYSKYLIVRDMHNRSNINGGWIMSNDARRLYFTNIRPRLRYTVSLSSQLLAKSGLTLKKEIHKTITTRTITPAYGFASKGSVLPSKLSSGLPLMSVNIDAVEIDFFHIPPEKILDFLRNASLGDNTNGYQLNYLNTIGTLAYSGRFDITAKENQQVVTNIDVQSIDALSKTGLYAAVLRQPGHYDYSYNATWFVISDLGVHVRRYRNSISAFTASLETGEAVADVELLLLNRKGKRITKTRADANGQASLSVPENSQPMILLATHNKNNTKELAVVDFRTPALDLAEFSISGRPWQAEELFVYAGRDIYRPGETANVSALLRDDDGHPITKRPLSVKVLRADGKLYMEYTWQAKASGYYHSEIYLDPDAPTGLWRVEVRNHPKQKKPLQVYKFKVEEFMPERMRLTLTPKQDILKPGQSLQVKVEGMYLYGSPTGGNRLQAKVTQQSVRQPLAALPGFIMGRQEDSKLIEKHDLDEVMLNEKGVFSIESLPLIRDVKSPMRFKLQASLFETGGRPVSRSTSALIWPQKVLPAIRPLMNKSHSYNYDNDNETTRWIADVNSKAGFEILLTNAQGVEQSGKVTARLIREERYYYWTHSNSGWERNYNAQAYIVDERQINLQANKRTKIHLPVEYGSYRLEIKSSTGGMSSVRFYAGWSWEDTGQVGYRPDRVNLELDKKSYAAGDIAKLTVRPPNAGLGVLTVENGDGLLMAKRIKLPKGETVLEIPIEKSWQRHDSYINLTLMRPGDKVELLAPSRAVGLLHLPLDRDEQKLSVMIDAPKHTKPLTDIYANIKVSTANGDAPIGQTYVTLYATDEGILQVTDFSTPNPWNYFFAKRGYSVDNRDMYGRIMDLLAGRKARLRFGGDAAARLRGRATMKLDMLALYSGMVQLDSYGMAKIPLKLPWFNGQVRLMATAFNDTQTGSSQHKTTVAAPIVTEVSLPRFLAMGDKSTMSLEMRNTQKQADDVVIDIYTTAPLKITHVQHKLHLAAGTRQNIKIPLQTASNAGIANIRFVLQSTDNRVERTKQLQIRPAWPMLRQQSRQIISAGQRWQWQLANYTPLMPASSSLTLNISPTPPLDTYAALKNLIQYPYGCLEQTSSRLMPLLFADVLRFSQNLTINNHALIGEKERVKAVEAGLLRLAGFQLENGAFNL